MAESLIAGTTRRALIAWCATRALLVMIALLPAERGALSDVGVYHDWTRWIWCDGLLPGRDFAWEYPPGALPFAAPPLGCGGFPSYLLRFVVLALLLDLLVTLVLHRQPQGPRAATVWLLLVPALGPLAISRYDVAVCLLVAVAFVLVARAPAAAGAALVAGAAVKVWPVLLLPLSLRLRDRGRVLAGAALATCALGAVFVASGTWRAFHSAWDYQQARGLHVESMGALPFAWLRVVGVGTTRFSHGGWEVRAAGADTTAGVLGLLQLLLVVWVLTTAVRGRRMTPAELAQRCTAVVCLLLVTDKVLSPQYVLWLVVMLAICAGYGVALPRAGVALAAVAAVGTHLVYPALYTGLLHGGVLAVLVLTVRDAALLGLALALVRAARGEPAPTDAAQPEDEGRRTAIAQRRLA